MSFAGFVLHLLLALPCALHAGRTGQSPWWLVVLFAVPVLGSVVYLLAVYLPTLHYADRVVDDPQLRASQIRCAIREAREAWERTPSTHNRMRLAAALLANGAAYEASAHYEGCLVGPFAADPEIRLAAAGACADAARFEQALMHIDRLRSECPEHRPERVALLQARCVASLGRCDAARACYEAAVARFDTLESRAEYAIWAIAFGDTRTADRLQQEIDTIAARGTMMSRTLNAPAMLRLQAARALSRRVA